MLINQENFWIKGCVPFVVFDTRGFPLTHGLALLCIRFLYDGLEYVQVDIVQFVDVQASPTANLVLAQFVEQLFVDAIERLVVADNFENIRLAHVLV